MKAEQRCLTNEGPDQRRTVESRTASQMTRSGRSQSDREIRGQQRGYQKEGINKYFSKTCHRCGSYNASKSVCSREVIEERETGAGPTFYKLSYIPTLFCGVRLKRTFVHSLSCILISLSVSAFLCVSMSDSLYPSSLCHCQCGTTYAEIKAPICLEHSA